MRRITIIATVAASIVALIGVAALLRARPAGANNKGARLRWAFVVQHVDTRLGDVTGLDLVDAQGRRALTRRPGGSSARDNNPRWSPDGRVVAFARTYEGEGLYVVSASGGRSRLLVPGEARDLAWSRDGCRLAFSLNCDAPCESGLYVLDRDGGRLQRLLPSAGPVSWSKDGASVVCLCGPLTNPMPTNPMLTIVRVDGSGAGGVLDRGVLGAPAWSPDGRLIAYGRNCDVMDPTGDVYCDLAVTTPSGSRRRTLLRHHPWRGPTDWSAPVSVDTSRHASGRLVITGARSPQRPTASRCRSRDASNGTSGCPRFPRRRVRRRHPLRFDRPARRLQCGRIRLDTTKHSCS